MYWVIIPPILVVFTSIFSEEIFDPPTIGDDGLWRPKGRRGCWGMPCGPEVFDPFADIPEDPLCTEPCPVCGVTHDRYQADLGHCHDEKGT